MVVLLAALMPTRACDRAGNVVRIDIDHALLRTVWPRHCLRHGLAMECELAIGIPLIVRAVVGNLRTLHDVLGGLANRGIEAAITVAAIRGAIAW